ncbi:MAG: sugar kinase [Pelagibaca sp.]
MTRIVSIGECMVELAPLAEAGTYRMGFAGDTLNTAWYLARLLKDRAQVAYYTAVGTDAVSDQMLTFLDRETIGTASILRRPDRTLGLYMIQLQEGERSFSYWRSQSAARTLAQSGQDIDTALSGASMAYFSGITLAILAEEDRATLLGALHRFRSAGGAVVFDPNLRPKLWPDGSTMTAAIMDAARLSDIVLPSHEDEATWFGDATPLDTAERYALAGAQTVVVKNGPGEIVMLDAGKTSRHRPEPVTEAVDTTAAGDSFNAGFLASRIIGASLDQAVEAAAQLAARVVSHRGALVTEAVSAGDLVG